MGDLLPIRVEREGRVAIRDGVLLCLFIRRPHVAAAEAVGALYDRYLELVGTETLRWYRAKEEWKESTPRQRNRLRRLMSADGGGRRDVRVALKGGDDPESEIIDGFDYWGDEAPGPSNAVASFVELRFSTQWVRARGMDGFAADAIDLAARVPFSSGYASLAFHIGMQVRGYIDDHAFEHPGMDVHANEYTSRDIGDHVRGAYWLTFVGPSGLEQLGASPDSLRSKLPSEIEVTRVGEGVALRAGDELRPGDTEAGDRLPLTRAVARVLEPITLRKTCAFGFTADDRAEQFAAWQRRHLT
jgi:hypothetical protein